MLITPLQLNLFQNHSLRRWLCSNIMVQVCGVEPTGLAFNSKLAVEIIKERSVNPLVNAGAMATAGFYDESGYWSMWTGLPSKTGVGGGIISVVPGEMAIAAFSPR